MKNESTKPLPLILFVKKNPKGKILLSSIESEKAKKIRKNQTIFIMRCRESILRIT